MAICTHFQIFSRLGCFFVLVNQGSMAYTMIEMFKACFANLLYFASLGV